MRYAAFTRDPEASAAAHLGLTEADLDARIADKLCPPCNGRCDQGRACPATTPQPAEAATDVGAEPDGPPPVMSGREALALAALIVLSSLLSLWILRTGVNAIAGAWA